MSNPEDEKTGEKSLVTRLREAGAEPIGPPPGVRSDPKSDSKAEPAASKPKAGAAPIPPLKSKPTTVTLKPDAREPRPRRWLVPLLVGGLAALVSAFWLVRGLVPYDLPRLSLPKFGNGVPVADAPRPPPVVDETALLRRRLTETEERLAVVTSEGRADKRTIETLQAKVAEQDRVIATTKPRADALEKEVAELRQQLKEVRESRPAPAPVSMPAPVASAPQAPRPTPTQPSAAPVQPPVAAAPQAPRPAPSPSPAPASPQPTAPSAAPRPAASGACGDVAARFRQPVNLFFDRNQGAVDQIHQRRLEEISSALGSCPSLGVAIKGFVEAREEASGGSGLSQRRAESAARAIEQRGIARNRVQVSRMQAGDQRASEETAEGRARNRRVEILVRQLN
jgi:outer membrane protein OmpA-like peptidoglycan-associated protein